MDRDRRLTGYLRGQTDNPTAPPGFELNNPWRVSRPKKLNREMLKAVRSRKDSNDTRSILLLLHGDNEIGVVTRRWVVFIEKPKLQDVHVITDVPMFPLFLTLTYVRSIYCMGLSERHTTRKLAYRVRGMKVREGKNLDNLTKTAEGLSSQLCYQSLDTLNLSFL